MHRVPKFLEKTYDCRRAVLYRRALHILRDLKGPGIALARVLKTHSRNQGRLHIWKNDTSRRRSLLQPTNRNPRPDGVALVAAVPLDLCVHGDRDERAWRETNASTFGTYVAFLPRSPGFPT